MIKLREKVNKTQVMNELRQELTKQLEGTYEAEYTTTVCMIGAEKLFEKLRLPHVIKAVCPNCDGLGYFESYGEIVNCGMCEGTGRTVL